MGLGNKERGNFITILGGKFAQKVPEGTAGAITRTNKLDKIVHERFYDSFTAKLIDIKTQEGDYGPTWLFVFQDGGEVYNLQLPYSNSFATAFLKMLPNIDLTKEMRLEPAIQEVDGKQKSSLFIKQNNVNIKHAYTKDVPNGMPNMEQVTVSGKLVWDDTKRLTFLYNMVQETILPKLPREASIATSEDRAMSVSTDAPVNDLDSVAEAVTEEEDAF